MKSNRISTDLLVALKIDDQSYEEVQNFNYLVTSTHTKEEISEDTQLSIAAGNIHNYGLKHRTIYRAVTYLLTPWSRSLLEKLTGSHLVKKFHAYYGTRWFVTEFTSARHLSLS
jgi:hypothetical protein